MMKLANIGASVGYVFPNTEGITIYVYKKGQITIPTKTSVYGSTSKTHLIPERPNTSYTYKYRIMQDDLLALDQPARRCHDNSGGLPSVSQCIADFFEATYNCSLYMIDSLGKIEDCTQSLWNNRTDDIASARHRNVELLKQWAMKTELEIYQTTGCMPSCKRQQIRLETEQETLTESTYPLLTLVFEYGDGMYDLNEEYLVYDHNNFIADIGGYLGLLLGHSILSVYSISADWITKPIRIIKSWISPEKKKKMSKTFTVEI